MSGGILILRWFRAFQHVHMYKQSSMADQDADLSPCNFATAHFPAERKDWPRPEKGLPGPSGPEPRKSPKRVLKETFGAGPAESGKIRPGVSNRVRKKGSFGKGVFSEKSIF